MVSSKSSESVSLRDLDCESSFDVRSVCLAKTPSHSIASIATPNSVNGIMAGVAGVISSYSSTSGVVLPAFLPTVSGLVERLGGGDPLEIALSNSFGFGGQNVSLIFRR
mgnify:CR=1 FL=1